MLRYEVPDHQGQEVLGAALHEHGYAWSSEFVGGRTHLVITSPDGAVDRERVRRILADQHRASLSGPDLIYTAVHFEDEPESRSAEPVRTPGRPPVQPAVPPPVPDPDGTTRGGGRRGLTAPLVRATLGGTLLAFPRAASRALVPDADEGDRALVRLLGARHVLQAVVTAARPTPTVLTAAAATDLLHGATALGYAALRPDHRRAALLSAGIAVAFGVADLRRARTRDGRRQEGRIPQVAVVVRPGCRRCTSPVTNAFGGHVIGSTATERRLRSAGNGSPVKSWT